uniref:Putative secreted protein n=1 Tax=Anopheles darlingi TaxID=43151 RepID=A0A2M4DR96_ANODA
MPSLPSNASNRRGNVLLPFAPLFAICAAIAFSSDWMRISKSFDSSPAPAAFDESPVAVDGTTTVSDDADDPSRISTSFPVHS